MLRIRLVLLALVVLLLPSVALAAEGESVTTGTEFARGAGVVAMIIAIAG
jgi:hypothetical protein